MTGLDRSAVQLAEAPDGTRSERRYTLTLYTVGEWVAMLHEAGFVDVDAFSSWAGDSPPLPEARLILRAR